MKRKVLIGFAVLAFQAQARAHGENEEGPHGGFIRMPGAFHTEVVPAGAASVKVYLLDMEWKNPTVKNSGVKISLASPKSAAVVCTARTDHFECKLPKGADLKKKGQLTVEATREGQAGSAASYPLPLKRDGAGGHDQHRM